MNAPGRSLRKDTMTRFEGRPIVVVYAGVLPGGIPSCFGVSFFRRSGGRDSSAVSNAVWRCRHLLPPDATWCGRHSAFRNVPHVIVLERVRFKGWVSSRNMPQEPFFYGATHDR